MAHQDRAIRTRRKILVAAANVFDREGYQGATITEVLKDAGVTKGALYFHFQSKDDLAYGVLNEPTEITVPPQPLKLQELIDTGLVLAERLRDDPLLRAGIRLALDPNAQSLGQNSVFQARSARHKELLLAAKGQGELLPHVDTDEVAELCVGAGAGLQLMSQALTDYADLPKRLASFQRHVMASVATPPVLASLDLSPTRGRRVLDEIERAETERAEAERAGTGAAEDLVPR